MQSILLSLQSTFRENPTNCSFIWASLINFFFLIKDIQTESELNKTSNNSVEGCARMGDVITTLWNR